MLPKSYACVPLTYINILAAYTTSWPGDGLSRLWQKFSMLVTSQWHVSQLQKDFQLE